MDGSINNVTDNNTSEQNFIFKFNLIFSLILLFVGLSLVGLSAFNIYEFYRKNENYEDVIAVITSYDIGDKGLRKEVLTYEVDGEKYDLKDKNFKQIPDEIGKIVPVKYNPNNPSDAIRIDETIDFVFPAISLVVFLIGFIKLIRTLKSKYGKKKIEEETQEQVQEHYHDEIMERNKTVHMVAPDQQTLGHLRLPSSNDENNQNQ